MATVIVNYEYQIIRMLRGETDTVTDELPDELHGVAPRLVALDEEHAVINEVRSLDEVQTDDDENYEWWRDLGWPSYDEWRTRHRDLPTREWGYMMVPRNDYNQA